MFNRDILYLLSGLIFVIGLMGSIYSITESSKYDTIKTKVYEECKVSGFKVDTQYYEGGVKCYDYHYNNTTPFHIMFLSMISFIMCIFSAIPLLVAIMDYIVFR